MRLCPSYRQSKLPGYSRLSSDGGNQGINDQGQATSRTQGPDMHPAPNFWAKALPEIRV
ncbi:hypothetical protein PILCRDRAFT_826809 [Piloderma croceum F 1598]|uniref:Uncharacterized protein n=1 Tax=Piloderma croceum (strain F 1598) TaxID=765440 RepID=A0A0C3F7R3_PILCF|nr:hypothetical protein PILCRDRAFT_826809 [Piloderma croceum F 1598]